jgi:WD40 repeat protein
MRCKLFTILLVVFLTGGSESASAQFKAVAVTPDGKVIAAGGSGGQICLWDMHTGVRLHKLKAAKTVQGLAFVRDEKTLAVGTDQDGVEIWTSRTAGYARTEQIGGTGIMYAVAVSADGKILAASGHSGWTTFYETTAWKPVGVIFERSNLTSGVSFAKDGSFLATAGNTFSIWNTMPSSPLWKPRGERPIPDIETTTKQSCRWSHSTEQEAGDEVYCADIAIAPDGNRVVGVNGTSRQDGGGKRLIAWDAATGKKVWTSRSTGMTCVVFTADGQRIATGSDDGTVRVWDSETGKILHEAKEHAKAIRNLAALSKGSEFVSAASDGTAALWDGQTGKRVREFRNQD